MAVIDFLRFIEMNPILLYYYAFSMLLSVSLGSLFLKYLGEQRIWNYFFSVLIHVVSVFGIFSLVVTFYQIRWRDSQMNLIEMLIPFFTMLIVVPVLGKRVNLAVITGYKSIWVYYIWAFILIAGLFFFDRLSWIQVTHWSLSWILVMILIMLFLFQRVSGWLVSYMNPGS